MTMTSGIPITFTHQAVNDCSARLRRLSTVLFSAIEDKEKGAVADKTNSATDDDTTHGNEEHYAKS